MLTYAKSDEKWMIAFFNELLFMENGVYTFLGSKPITRISLAHFTEEEKAEYIASLSKEELANSQLLSSYDLATHWEQWKKIKDQFPLKRYFLIEKEDEDHMKYLYFVNIFQTAITIQENYQAFYSAVKKDFHPLEVTLEIEDTKSSFWNAIEDNAQLLGLLLGYGRVNSYAFHWKNKEATPRITKFMENIENRKKDSEFVGDISFNTAYFDLPSFISFEMKDSKIEQYQKEREKIQKMYKGKNFLQYTLDILTQ